MKRANLFEKAQYIFQLKFVIFQSPLYKKYMLKSNLFQNRHWHRFSICFRVISTHFEGKNHEKKEFRNSNVGGKQIENSFWCKFSNKYDFSNFLPEPNL